MRRTRLAAAAFAGSVCLATLTPVAVAAEPVAEVSPHRVRPGGTVTVTVICGKHDEKVGYIVAYSRAFEKGEARLKLLPRGGDRHGKKTTYSGRARIVSAHHSAGSWSSGPYGADDGDLSYGSSSGPYSAEESGSTAEDLPGSDDDSGTDDSYGSGDSFGTEDMYGSGDGFGTEDAYGSGEDDGAADSSVGKESGGPDDGYGGASRHGKRYAVNGSCPDGRDFTASVVVERKPRGGADAGTGGSQGSVSTAAVAAGGILVSATVGFGVHALRRRRSEV